MGVGVSVAEECGEEVDLRGKGFPSLESLLLRLRRTLESCATGSRIGVRDDDWGVCPCYNPCYWIPHFCGMTL